MRNFSPTVIVLEISSTIYALSLFSLPQSDSRLASDGGKASEAGISKASKIAATYGPVIG